MLVLNSRLLGCALLTAFMETPLFYWCGYQKLKCIGAFFVANIVSNLLLNEALPPFDGTAAYWLTLALGEALVVAVEFFWMAYLVREKGRLFRIVCFTNAVTLAAGLLLF